MPYVVSEIYIGRHFLKNSGYLQQIISVVAKESLIPNSLTQKSPGTQNFHYCNSKCDRKAKSDKCDIRLSFLEQ